VEVRAVERMEVVAQVAEAWVGEGRAEVAQAGGGLGGGGVGGGGMGGGGVGGGGVGGGGVGGGGGGGDGLENIAWLAMGWTRQMTSTSDIQWRLWRGVA
jgi:uncharacterized membrane protein